MQEREEQVGQMRMVYSCARSVVVWLGEKNQNSDAAMQFLVDIEKNVDLRRLERESALPMQMAAWSAVFALLRRPWWSRVWIIQEISVGKSDPLLGCGNKWVPWSKFEILDQILGELEEEGARIVQNLHNPISRLRNIRLGAQSRRHTAWRSLFLLLRSTQDCQATDSRDKVFALLGLSSENDQHAVHPDYTKSTVEVYTGVTRHIIRSENSLNILMYFKPSELPGLPSWVPDFTLSSYLSHLDRPAGKGASGDTKPVVEFLDDFRIKVQGWIVDQVQETSREVYDAENPSVGLSSFEALARKTLSVVNPTDQDIARLSERFWRCLIVDSTLNNEFPAPQSYRHLYSVFSGKAPLPEDYMDDTSDDQARRDSYLYPLTSSMDSALTGRRFFITSKARLGLGPPDTQEGDLIVVLKGADTPFVLRESEDAGVYLILREAYVSGLMFGELFTEESSENLDKGCRDFIIY
jgi:hypothetical protein